MKKIVVLGLTIVFVLSACGGGGQEGPSDTDIQTAIAKTQASAPSVMA